MIRTYEDRILRLIFSFLSVFLGFSSFSMKNGESPFFLSGETVNGDSLKIQQLYKKAANHFNSQQYDSTTSCLYKLLSTPKIDKKTNVKSLVLLGLTLSRNNMHDKALLFYNEALSLNHKEDKLLESQIYGNIGEIYFYKNEYKTAISYFEKDLELKMDIKTTDQQITLSNLGAAYIQWKKPELALPYIQRAFDLAKSTQDSIGQSICINNLATIYRDLQNYQQAIRYLEDALQLVNKIGSKEEKKTILYNLFELSELTNNKSKALQYLKDYTLLKDEILTQENAEFIVETQEKYDAEKRLKELAEMKIRIQKKEAQNKQFIFNAIILSIFFAILFASILIGNRWRLTKQKNEAKLQVIHATMQGEENQRIKIAQELHDDLGGLLGISRMLFTKVKTEFKEGDPILINRIDDLLVQANTKSRSISHELFSPTLKQFGLAAALSDYINNYKLLDPNLQVVFNCFAERVNEKIELNLFRITQELVSNTLKHANATSILLMLEKTETSIEFQYQDNGKGFNQEEITKGIGLSSMEARVKLVKGSIHVNSNETGTSVKISIPV